MDSSPRGHHGHRRRLAVTALLALSLVLSGVGSGRAPVAAAQVPARSESAAQAQDVTLTGELLAIWGDPAPGAKIKKDVIYTLFDDQGQTTELELDENVARAAGGPLALVKKRVELQGDRILLDANAENSTRVRYCWGDAPICNLYDRSGLPAGPFEMEVNSQ